MADIVIALHLVPQVSSRLARTRDGQAQPSGLRRVTGRRRVQGWNPQKTVRLHKQQRHGDTHGLHAPSGFRHSLSSCGSRRGRLTADPAQGSRPTGSGASNWAQLAKNCSCAPHIDAAVESVPSTDRRFARTSPALLGVEPFDSSRPTKGRRKAVSAELLPGGSCGRCRNTSRPSRCSNSEFSGFGPASGRDSRLCLALPLGRQMLGWLLRMLEQPGRRLQSLLLRPQTLRIPNRHP